MLMKPVPQTNWATGSEQGDRLPSDRPWLERECDKAERMDAVLNRCRNRKHKKPSDPDENTHSHEDVCVPERATQSGYASRQRCSSGHT